MATFKVSRELISERELIERAFCEGYEYALEEQREFGVKSFFRKINPFNKIKGKVRAAYYKGAREGIERGLEKATMKDAFKNMTKGQKAAAIAAAAGVSGLAVKGGLDIANGR
jgi:hypothetical protein